MNTTRLYNFLFWGITSLIVSFFEFSGEIGPKIAFWYGTIALVSYNLVEIKNIYNTERRLWLANPVVLGTTYSFVVFLGVTNIGFEIFDQFYAPAFQFTGNQSALYRWGYKVLMLALVSSVGIWFGYHSRAARIFCSVTSGLRDKTLTGNFKPRWNIVYASFAVGLAANIYLLSSGLGGWYTDPSAPKWYRQYLSLLSSLQYVAPVFLAFDYAATRNKKSLVWAVLAISIQVAIGTISGFKNAVVFPLIPPLLAYYVRSEKIPYKGGAIAVVLLVFSFFIVTPFRSVFDRTQEVNLSRVATTLSHVVTAGPVAYKSGLLGFSEHLLNRLNHTGQAAGMLQLKHSDSFGPHAPKFMRRIVLSPAMAVVPRAVWPSKPRATVGGWASAKLRGNPINTRGRSNSTGITPVLYLYFSGGIIACFVGFYVLGIIYKFTIDTVLLYGSSGLIIYLLVINQIVRMDHLYYPMIMRMIRYVPIGILAQYLLLRR